MEYNYFEDTILIHEEYKRFEETRESLVEGLEAQASPEKVEAEDLLEDETLEIPESVFEGETTAEPLEKYSLESIGEDRAVYLFDHSLGLEVLGDYAMIRQAMPEYIPDSVIPMQNL